MGSNPIVSTIPLVVKTNSGKPIRAVYSAFVQGTGTMRIEYWTTWGYNSVGRVSALQAEGRRFESCYLHAGNRTQTLFVLHCLFLLCLKTRISGKAFVRVTVLWANGKSLGCNPRDVGSIPTLTSILTKDCF